MKELPIVVYAQMFLLWEHFFSVFMFRAINMCTYNIIIMCVYILLSLDEITYISSLGNMKETWPSFMFQLIQKLMGHVYVCLCVCLCVCVYVCVCMCVYILYMCVYIIICVCIYVCVLFWSQVCTPIQLEHLTN